MLFRSVQQAQNTSSTDHLLRLCTCTSNSVSPREQGQGQARTSKLAIDLRLWQGDEDCDLATYIITFKDEGASAWLFDGSVRLLDEEIVGMPFLCPTIPECSLLLLPVCRNMPRMLRAHVSSLQTRSSGAHQREAAPLREPLHGGLTRKGHTSDG